MFITNPHNATLIIVANSFSRAPVIMRWVDGTLKGTLLSMCVVGTGKLGTSNVRMRGNPWRIELL